MQSRHIKDGKFQPSEYFPTAENYISWLEDRVEAETENWKALKEVVVRKDAEIRILRTMVTGKKRRHLLVSWVCPACGSTETRWYEMPKKKFTGDVKANVDEFNHLLWEDQNCGICESDGAELTVHEEWEG